MNCFLSRLPYSPHSTLYPSSRATSFAIRSSATSSKATLRSANCPAICSDWMICAMPSRVGTPLPLDVRARSTYVSSAACRSTLKKLAISATLFSFDCKMARRAKSRDAGTHFTAFGGVFRAEDLHGGEDEINKCLGVLSCGLERDLERDVRGAAETGEADLLIPEILDVADSRPREARV